MNNLIIVGLAASASMSLGFTITATIYFALQKIFINRADKFRPEENTKRLEKVQLRKVGDKETFYWIFGGAFVFALMTLGSSVMFLAVMFGAGTGFFAGKIFKKVMNKSREYNKIKEVSLLYENIDLFTKAGYTVRQSLQVSKVLVPNLRKEIDACLMRWPSGPLNALERLGEDIGVEYADTLSGLLMQAEESGTENIKGIMEQESIRLEGLREKLAESKIASKPIYNTIYLIMPVASVVSLLIGPLLYKIIVMLTTMRAGG